MRVVMVGAGSVGQVYGWHLAQAGCKVTFLVREHHREALEAGLVLYPWNRRDRTTPLHWRDYDIATDNEQALAAPVDVVAIATSSTALQAGTWFEELVAASGDATLLILQPGSHIPPWVLERAPAERVVFGLISLTAWPAPLPGQDLPEPGQAWWIPWGSQLGFSGAVDRAMPIIAAMSKGGAASRLRDDVETDQAFAGPALAFVVITLELAGWSMDALCRDPELLSLAHRSMSACWAWAEQVTGQRTPFVLRQLTPGRIRFVLRRVLPWAPLDFETFFRVHYTKVADQTPVLLDHRIDALEAQGVDATPLKALAERLEGVRGA